MKKEIVSGSDNYMHPVKMQGKTEDIIQGIIEADKCAVGYVTDNVSFLQGKTILQTCHNIYNLVRENIPYNEDEEGVQWIQSPGQLWTNRYKDKGGTGEGGDCKSMSIFCAAILKALGNYDFKYRFVSEYPDDDFYHVYLIVQDDAGDGYITLDCTLKHFNRELNIAKHLDVDPSGPDATCPFPSPGVSGIGAPTYQPNKTAEQNTGTLWAAHETAYAAQHANNQTYIDGLRSQMLAEITAFFSDPIKKSHAHGFIWDNWDAHLKCSALCIYSYWGDTSLELMDFPANKIPPISNVDIWIGPVEITLKKQNSDNYISDLKGMGLSDSSIKSLVALSVYNNHGITLDYMLYRCYNKLVYGQEWGPEPGVPYYDANTKTFYANGATADEYNALLNAFPIDGGTGKPWGVPYIARGVFVMTNGASDTDIKYLTDLINLHGWDAYINTYVFSGGNKTYTQISEDDILKATTMYYKWQQGQLPVLYASPVAGTQGGSIVLSGSKIGVPVQVIVGLVVAILNVIGAIIGALLQFLAHAKTALGAMQANPPMTPIDFKLQYQTADGCAIGFTDSCTNGIAKVCNSGILCNPDLTLPENQPSDGNFGKKPPISPGVYVALGLGAIGILALASDDED